ncbi:MAG: hypothetical protein RLY71_2794 [Pseudomonadota bacterium]|jgi:hypothetical protein
MNHHARPLITLLLACAFAAGRPAAAAAAATPPTQPDCLGERQPLTVAGQMPYALVSVGGREGYMVLDFGASVSSITPANFQGGAPQPADGSSNRFGDFVFFGSWGTVQLPVQAQPAVQWLRTADGQASIQQAGVIGTDFLAQHVYTLDYRAGHLWRAASGSFCTDAALQGAGYRPVTTQHYYGPQPGSLSCPMAGAAPGGCVNIPTIPIRIGRVQAVAQLDTGYDDSRQPYSVNINAALFDALKAAKVTLKARPDISIQLSTCVAGVSEALEAYSVAGTQFGLVETSGKLVPHKARSVTLFVKRTPDAAAACGGIGTWQQPAAQLGASFVAGGALVVDPFSARVWLR